MYLKRLEIQGFKSFADKVDFEFSPGITAIVGPNGSGKSNVVDSIRWVLGEQSAKSLRGSKMDDVIFAGSVDRRPVGMAQVALTLDNSGGLFPLDYSEVTVARRLYRSGESEYLINKTPCRLKDIHELFMDTGLGREGFSIISQGKVDEILSLKPEDRRGLIEEAAGIIKYKHRKREAERKLEDTEENMVRLNDIISELKERVEPLGEQAEKAKSYQVWKTELDDLEISLEVSHIEANVVEEKNLSNNLGDVENQLACQMAEYGQFEAQLQQNKLELQNLDQVINTEQENYYDLQNQIEKKETEITLADQLKANFSEQQKKLQAEITYFKHETQVIAENYKQKSQEAELLASSYEQDRKDNQKLDRMIREKQTQQQNITLQLQQCQDNTIQNMRDQAKNNNETMRLKQELQNNDKRLLRLEEKTAKLAHEKEQVTTELNTLQEEEACHEAAYKAYEHSLEQQRSSYAVKQAALIQQRQLFEERQYMLQQVQSKHQALKELEESGDGYQFGVKSVLEQKKQGSLTGIIGTVAQLVKVPDYLEKAIETVMGASLQNIVVENDGSAQKAIAFLKKHQKGRATFLPMNTIKGNKSTETFNDPNILGLAVDLIEFAPEYRSIMNYLVGRVWVVRDLASAVALGKQKGFSQRLVTLDGDLITPGGAMTGGNYAKQKGGLLSRQRQITELADQVTLLVEETDQLKAAIDQSTDILTALQQSLNEAASEGQHYLLHRQELGQMKEQLFKEKHRISNELDIELLDKNQIDADIRQLQQQLADASASTAEIEQAKAALEQEIIDLKKNQQLLESELEQLSLQYQQSQIQLATSQQKLTMFKEQYEQLNTRHNELLKQLQQKENDLLELAQKNEDKDQEIDDNKHELHRLTQLFSQQQQTLQGHKEERSALQEKINRLDDQTRERQQQLDQQKDRKYQLDMSLNKVRLLIENGLKHLQQSFECSYDAAILRKISIPDEKEAAKRVSKLKHAIQSLGAINFNAIEEHQQVQERLAFLTEQMEDLYQAREALNKVIKEMEQIMALKFKETYQVVNETFSSVFKSMFDGGQARLELSAPHDYLLTGIEIVAQPPGKKEQILSLLSGGERAMTAIALLFALLTVKPSPFCILDEIEAALDEVNVERFARFIKDYTSKTQFIVISHRKGTMEAADSLYGVAMENNGVSRLMSVKLADYE